MRIIRFGVIILILAAITGGGTSLYARHSLTKKIDATAHHIASHYSTLAVVNVPALLEHSDITEGQQEMLHALSSTGESLEQAKAMEDLLRAIVDFQMQAHLFIGTLLSKQSALATDEHFLSLARETGERSSIREDIEQYNNLLIRIRGTEEGKRASLLPIESSYDSLPFLRFDGPAQAKAEVHI